MLKLKEFDDVWLVDPKRKEKSMTLYNLYLEDCGSIWLSGLFTGVEEANIHVDDVILLNLEACLIT
jgi:hypothetical protein